MIIPPDILKKILHKIEEDIKSNARLKLCEDPENNIWNCQINTYCFARLPDVDIEYPFSGSVTPDEFI